MVNFCKFAKAIKQHFDENGTNLEAALKQAGAGADEAKQIDKFIQNRIKDKTGTAKAELVKKALNKDLTKSEQKAAFDRLVNESHKGGLNEFTVKQAVGESMGITQLTKEQRENIQNLAKALNKEPVGSNGRKVLAQKLSAAINDIKPRTVGEYLKTGIFVGDLLNPVTQIKNIFGNGIYSGWRAVNAQAAGALDWAYVGANNLLGGKATRERFVTLADSQAYNRAVQDFWSGLKEGAQEAWEGINTTNLVDDKYNLTGRQVFKDFNAFGKKVFNPLAFMEKVTKVALSAPDRAFYKMAAGQEVEQLLKAAKAADPKFNGIPTPEMLEIAHLEGLKATFQDSNKVTDGFKFVKDGLNKVGIGDIGLGDIAMTYTKTPANIAARAWEMTPLNTFTGAIDLLSKLKQGELIQRGKLLESATNTAMGTGLLAASAYLGKMGIVSASMPSQEVGANQKAQGKQAFSVNIDALSRFVYSGGNSKAAKPKTGDKLVGYGWAQPVAIPVSMGAAIGAKLSEPLPKDKTVAFTQLVGQATSAAGQTFLEASPVQGLQNLFDGQPNDKFAGVKKTLSGVPGRFLPGRSLLAQVARVFDPMQRETYDPNAGKQITNQIQAGIPGLSQKLPAKVDVTGKPIQRGDDNIAVRALNTFLNPAQMSKIKNDPEVNEVVRLYEETGEKGQLLKQADKKVQITDIGGNKIVKQLDGRELGKYQTFLGRESKAIMSEALQNADFGEMDDNEKADILQKVIKGTNEAAKIKLFKHNPKKVSPLAQAILDEDTDLVASELQTIIDKQANKPDVGDQEYEGIQNE